MTRRIVLRSCLTLFLAAVLLGDVNNVFGIFGKDVVLQSAEKVSTSGDESGLTLLKSL